MQTARLTGVAAEPSSESGGLGVDLSANPDQEVLENLLESIQKGTAFGAGGSGGASKTRAPRPAGARRAGQRAMPASARKLGDASSSARDAHPSYDQLLNVLAQDSN